MSRIPHLIKKTGSNLRLTLLDCHVCGGLGHFAIQHVATVGGRRVYACPNCARRADSDAITSAGAGSGESSAVNQLFSHNREQ